MEKKDQIKISGESIKVKGIITKILGRGEFQVTLNVPNTKLDKKMITAYASGNMRHNFINLSLDNEVMVLIDLRFMNRGRIVFRNKKSSNSDL
jgi:translation initiation factor IF-1